MPSQKDYSGHIVNRRAFSASGLSAVEGISGPGRLSDDETREYRKSNPTYTVKSYDTPIAWHGDLGWQLSSTKYSRTTSKHQSIVRNAVRSHFDGGHDGARQG
jgi:hypothetical protein